jgi:hypothetical protein
MTAPGTILWRIGSRSRAPLRCEVLRDVGNGFVTVRASRFARTELRMLAADAFTTPEACRAEIQRRANETREPPP